MASERRNVRYAHARHNTDPSISDVESGGVESESPGLGLISALQVLAGSCECLAVLARKLNLGESYESLLESGKGRGRSSSLNSAQEVDSLVSAQPTSSPEHAGGGARPEYSDIELYGHTGPGDVELGGQPSAAHSSIDDRLDGTGRGASDSIVSNPLVSDLGHGGGGFAAAIPHMVTQPPPPPPEVPRVVDTANPAPPKAPIVANEPATESVADMIARASASEWGLMAPMPATTSSVRTSEAREPAPQVAADAKIAAPTVELAAAEPPPAAQESASESTAQMMDRIAQGIEWNVTAPSTAPVTTAPEGGSEQHPPRGAEASPHAFECVDDEGEQYCDDEDEYDEQSDPYTGTHFDPDDAEPEEDYRPGGYHPAKVGDVLQERYELTARLGWGMYSTVWRGVTQGGSSVAIKLQKSQEDYYRAAQNEIDILKLATAADGDGGSYVVALLDAFDVSGPNGRHPCMVFEELGESLFAVLQQHDQIPVPTTQAITTQILKGLAFLHDNNILHTDLKPENVLMVSTFEPGAAVAVKIVDLGNACKLDEQEVEDIQTREYRCPESMLGIWPFLPQADIWSLGCLVFELVSAETLFDPKLPEHLAEDEALEDEDFIKDESHLMQCIELLGPIPLAVIRKGARANEWFDLETGEFKPGTIPLPHPDVIKEVLAGTFGVEADGAAEVAEFIRSALVFDAQLRPSAKRLLKHAFCLPACLTD